MRLFYILLVFFTTFCNEQKDRVIRCDYVDRTNNKVLFYSTLRYNKGDTIYSKLYLKPPINSDILFKKPDFVDYSTYTCDEYKLYDVILLKLNSNIGDTWRSPFEKGYYDSLSVTLEHVFQDTILNNINVQKCNVYKVEYDKHSFIDSRDFRIFFDTKDYYVIRKEYYIGKRNTGSEQLLRIIPM